MGDNHLHRANDGHLARAANGHLVHGVRIAASQVPTTVNATSRYFRTAWYYEYGDESEFFSKDSHLVDLQSEWTEHEDWGSASFPFDSVAAQFYNFSNYGWDGASWAVSVEAKVFWILPELIGRDITSAAISATGTHLPQGTGEARIAIATSDLDPYRNDSLPMSYEELAALPYGVVTEDGKVEFAAELTVGKYLFIIGYFAGFEGPDVNESRRYWDTDYETTRAWFDFSDDLTVTL